MLTEVMIFFTGGHGGSGKVSFRRERYVPRGGPDGGDGGDGGSIVLVADQSIRMLDELRRQPEIRAESGYDGSSVKRHGRNGRDEEVHVPVGTLLWLNEEEIADLASHGMSILIARGGRGGKGNARFARAARQAPRFAEQGLAGESLQVRLELRLIADAGLVGLPNAGKSTLLRAVSQAQPAVGAYPFTTLEPYLGIVEVGYDTFVMADIPGLIEGAHEGTGLGIDFLQHIRRTRVLIHVVDGGAVNPIADIDIVRKEVEAFGQGIGEKPWIVALNKLDLPAAKEQEHNVVSMLKQRDIEVFSISATNKAGTAQLAERLLQLIQVEHKRAAEQAVKEPPTLRPKPQVQKFKILRLKSGFSVRGSAASEIVEMLGLESEEARLEVMRRLRRLGVVSALVKAGIAPGDRVRIGGEELEWPA